jgi:hypothetical protein
MAKRMDHFILLEHPHILNFMHSLLPVGTVTKLNQVEMVPIHTGKMCLPSSCITTNVYLPGIDFNRRFAYSEEGGENFDDEDALPLKAATTFEPEKIHMKSESKERTTDVFNLTEETEEDKRE